MAAPCWRDQRESGFGQSGDSDHRNFLHVGAVVAGRLQSIQRELRGDVFGGDVAAALSGAAAFEQIVRQEATCERMCSGLMVSSAAKAGPGSFTEGSFEASACSSISPRQTQADKDKAGRNLPGIPRRDLRNIDRLSPNRAHASARDA